MLIALVGIIDGLFAKPGDQGCTGVFRIHIDISVGDGLVNDLGTDLEISFYGDSRVLQSKAVDLSYDDGFRKILGAYNDGIGIGKSNRMGSNSGSRQR